MDEIRIADSKPTKEPKKFANLDFVIVGIIVILTIIIILNAIEAHYKNKQNIADLTIAHLLAETRPITYEITPTELNAIFEENQPAQFRAKLTEDKLFNSLFDEPQYKPETCRRRRVNMIRY